MSGQSKITQTIVAAFAALLMSSAAVGAAVGPAHVFTAPIGTTLNA